MSARLQIKIKTLTVFGAVALLFLLAGIFYNFALAETTPQINYQGKLTSASGVAVADGTYNMRFWLLTTPSIATTSAVWTESLTTTSRVQVTGGLFSVMLGSSTPLTGVDFNQALYLGVEIGSTTTVPSWDGEMSPRKIIGTVPAAFEARRLDGVASSSFLRSDEPDTMQATSSNTLLTLVQNGVGAIARFFSGATEVFTILANGNVGVGTSTPSQQFTVAGNARITGALFDGTNASGTQGMVLQATGTTTRWVATSTLGFSTVGILDDLTDVTISTPGTGSVLSYNGSQWVNAATSTLGLSASFTTSAQLAALLSDETGTGASVFSTLPTLAGFISTASSTIGGGTAATGLTIAGNATTTGSAYFVGNVGIGTTTRTANLNIFTTSNAESLNITSTAITTASAFTVTAPLSTSVSDGKAFQFTVPGEFFARGMFYTDGSYGVGPGGNSTRDLYINRLSTSTLMVSSNRATSGAANMVVTGAVGIGTTTLSAKLSISANVGDTFTNLFQVSSSTSATATTQLMTVRSNGNVGVGTSTPVSLFSVGGGTGSGSNLGNTVTLVGLENTTDAISGAVYLAGGSGVAASNATGGTILVQGNQGQNGGSVFITSGNSNNNAGVSNINLTAGSASNSGGGSVIISGGAGNNGRSGNVYLFPGTVGGVGYGNIVLGANNAGTIGGSIGIGTTSPSALLTIAGDMRLTGRLADSSSSTGSVGQILSVSTNGTSWVSTSTLGLLANANIDTSAELAAILGDETGTAGSVVFSASPTFTGTSIFSSLRATASSTIGGGTPTTGLTIAGNSTTTGSAYIAGNLGIGTTTPGTLLEVAGAGTFLGTTTLKSLGADNPLSITNASPSTLTGALDFSFANSTGPSGFNTYTFKGANSRLAFENANDGATGSFFMSYLTMQFAYNGVNVLGLTQAGRVGSLVPSVSPSPTWRNLLDDGSGNGYFSGTLGIGTTSPSALLTVAGDMRLTGRFADSASSTGTFGQILSVSANGTSWVSTSTLGLLANANIDTSAELAAILGDETGTAGSVVFSASPTFTGTSIFSSLRATASSTIGGGTPTTGLTIAGNSTTTGSAFIATSLGIGVQPGSQLLAVGNLASAYATGTMSVFQTTGPGTTVGNFAIVAQNVTRANTVSSNMVQQYLALRRSATPTGTDWETVSWHDGIGIDGTYMTPGVNSRTWWERSPWNATHSWGDQATTYMALNSTGLGIGSTSPSAKLSVTNTGSGPSFIVEDSASPDTTPFIIDSAGLVGIGTSSLESRLSVYGGYAPINGTVFFHQDSAANNPTLRLFQEGQGGGANDTQGLLVQVQGNVLSNIADFAYWDGSTSTSRLTVRRNGNVGIGTSTPTAMLDIRSGGGGIHLVMGDEFANATNKVARAGAVHYTISEEPVAAFVVSNISNANGVLIGGGSSVMNAATQVAFYTAANNTTTIGTERMRIESNGLVGIGTTSPSALLTVAGDMRLTGRLADSASSTGTLGQILSVSANGTSWISTSTLGLLANANIDTSAELAAILGDETGSGSVVFATAPALSGTTTFSGLSGTNVFATGTVSSTNAIFVSATSTNLGLTRLNIGGDSLTELVGSGLAVSGTSLTVDNVTADMLNNSDFGDFTCNGTTCAVDANTILAADMANGDHGFFSYTSNVASLDADGLTSANLLSAISNETGTGSVVFSASPTFTGTSIFSSLRATASSTIGGGTPTTGLTIAGNSTTTGNLAVQGTSIFTATTTNTVGATFGGYVGIGTTLPTSPLTIVASTTDNTFPTIRVINTVSSSTVSGSAAITLGRSGSQAMGEIRAYNSPGTYGEGHLAFSSRTGEALVERMRILNNGNVGIGTPTPSAKLTVNAIPGDSNSALFTVASSTAVATTTHFTVLAGGSVGVGSTTPSALLGVQQNSTNYFTFGNGAPSLFNLVSDNDSTPVFSLTGTGLARIFTVNDVAGDTTPFVVDANGNVGIGTSSPSARLSVSSSTATTIRIENTGSALTTGDIVGAITFFQNDASVNGRGDKVYIQALADNSSGQSTALVLATSDGNSATGIEALRIEGNGTTRLKSGSGGGSLILGADVNDRIFTANTRKVARILSPRFASADGNDTSNVFMISGDNDGANNGVYVGGYPGGSQIAASYISFLTSAGTTTTGGTERMVIDRSGLVGIGTTTPSSLLSIVGTTTNFGINFIGTGVSGRTHRIYSDGGFNLALDVTSGAVNIQRNATTLFSVGGANSGSATYLNQQFGVGSTTPSAYMTVTNTGSSPSFIVEDSSADTSPFIIDAAGLVGIGTTTPVSTLSIQGSLCVRDTGSCGTTAGTIYATTASISDIDLAENYRAIDLSLAAGEIVAIDVNATATIKRAESGDVLLGIISTAPGLLLGQDIKDGKPVALKGRVPLRVNMEGGEIKAGDPITLSSVPGVGTKATTTTQIVGIALNAQSEDGLVEVFVENRAYIAPDRYAALNEFFNFAATSTEAEEPAEDSFMAKFMGRVYTQLTAWFAQVGNGIGDMFANSFRASEEICVDDQCLTRDDIADLLGQVRDGGGNSGGGSSAPVEPEGDTGDGEGEAGGGSEGEEPTPPAESGEGEGTPPEEPAPQTGTTGEEPAPTE